MPQTVKNPWKAKSIELDRYRWLVLRERHGFLGAALRFARDALADAWFGSMAKRRIAAQITTEPCDFLLLQSAPKVIGLRRKRLIIDSLRARGYRLTETALPERRDIGAQRMLIHPPHPTPIRYFAYAAHAAWIVARFRPRILLNDRNGSFYSPFLRLTLRTQGGMLVHLAHATTVESSRRLGMNDYDYYFLFGLSSLEALQTRTLRFGSSTVLLTGSHMVDKSFDLPPPEPHLHTVLILGVGPDKEKERGYQRTYSLLRDWAREAPQYRVLVKSHPRSSVSFWQEVAKDMKNVAVLPKEFSLAQALRQASVVVNIMSNAVIEAGLAARPVIYCNLSDDYDIFHQENYFGPVVDSVVEFRIRMQTIEDNFPEYVEKAKAFSTYHLAHGSLGLKKTLQTLESLLADTEPPQGISRFCLTENGMDNS